MISAQEKAWTADVYAQCVQKYQQVALRYGDGIPYTTGPDGRYDNRADTGKPWHITDGINWWTNGVWGGILWHVYLATGDGAMKAMAMRNEALLDTCFQMYHGLHHDVGFMWIPTAVASHTLTGSDESQKRALHAASLLLSRFNLAGGFLRAWNGPKDEPGKDTRGWVIIDSMMNIPLLYWASVQTQDPRFAHIANAHVKTVMDTFLRPDGSVDHIVEYDPDVGGKVRSYGGQGYRDGSAWTRGQSWALYGFALAYRDTGNQAYLHTAIKIADYFAAQIPPSGLIPVDFCQPPAPALEDSSAAAIAACGFLELKEHCPDKAQAYQGAALAMLWALHSQRCDYSLACDAIVRKCTGAYHISQTHHITLVYADYFYMQALQRVGGASRFLW